MASLPDEQMMDEPTAQEGIDQSTTTASSSSSLSPRDYTEWVRSAERMLLSNAAQGEPPTQVLLQGLETSMEAKHSALVLNARQWKVWCSLSLWSLSHSTSTTSGDGGSSTVQDPSQLKQVLDLHLEATRSSNGSSLELTAFVTYVSVVMHYHYAFEEASKPPRAFWEEDEDEDQSSQWRLEQVTEYLQEWTGLQGGPRFLDVRHAGTRLRLLIGYDHSSLPSIPTRTQARDAGQEAEWDALLGEEAVRETVREVNTRAAGECNWSHLVWDPLRDFELYHLSRADRLSAAAKAEAIKQVFLARLQVPHRTHEETAEIFSNFVTKNFPHSAYTSTMETSQKFYAPTKAAWIKYIEGREDQIRGAVVPSAGSSTEDQTRQWQAWKSYLKAASSTRRDVNVERVSSLFERCIAYLGLPPSIQSREVEEHAPDETWEADFAKQRKKLPKQQRVDIEKAERDSNREAWQRREEVWSDYVGFLTTAKAPASQVVEVLERSVRSLPASGLLWGNYLRQLARLFRSKTEIDKTFSRALEGGECARDDEQRGKDGVELKHHLVELLTGRIDAERETSAIALAREQSCPISTALALLPQDADRFMEVFALISYALGIPEQRPAAASDPALRLQRLASSWVEGAGEGMSSLVEPLWDTTMTQQPTNGLAWSHAAAFFTRSRNVEKARSLYQQGCRKSGVTEKMRLLEEWKAFETVYGSAEDVLRADERLRGEKNRQWEEWAAYTQMQQEQYAAAYGSSSNNGAGGMEVDTGGAAEADASVDLGSKRARRDDDRDERGQRAMSVVSDTVSTSKKGKAGSSDEPTRDRENSSVLVAKLPVDATQLELERLFKDCGAIREISGPKVVTTEGSAAAAAGIVEFMDRSSIASARTKDRKKVRGQEVSVSLGWECTLYVTNFPETMDDTGIRALFGQYGPIYDVRWPSKRFASSRRFCYVQFTSSSSAKEALALHQTQLAADDPHYLQVHLSDPSRKTQRTDANAQERELYVTGLHRSCKPEEVQAIFAEQGDLIGFRMPTKPRDDPSSPLAYKGLAFVDYRTPLDAAKALTELNGRLINGKAIKVQLADPSHKAGHQHPPSAVAAAEASSSSKKNGSTSGFTARAIVVRGLPRDAQEPLIQQLFEKMTAAATSNNGRVVKVEWTQQTSMTDDSTVSSNAIIEFDSPGTAGKVVLACQGAKDGIYYDGNHPLEVVPLEATVKKIGGGAGQRQDGPSARINFENSSTATTSADGPEERPAAFAPRSTVARGKKRGGGRGGLGFSGSQSATGSSRTQNGSGNAGGEAMEE